MTFFPTGCAVLVEHNRVDISWSTFSFISPIRALSLRIDHAFKMKN